MFNFKILIVTISIAFFVFGNIAKASTMDELADLQKAYPDSTLTLSEKDIIWYDAGTMVVSDGKNNKTTPDKT